MPGFDLTEFYAELQGRPESKGSLDMEGRWSHIPPGSILSGMLEDDYVETSDYDKFVDEQEEKHYFRDSLAKAMLSVMLGEDWTGVEDLEEIDWEEIACSELELRVDDIPVDGATRDPISSNWAYDHAAELDAHQTITNAPTGFPNRTDSVLSFVAGTRTFTIAPAVTSFDFYIAGVKYTKSSQEDIIIAGTSGLHAIYYGGATLSEEVNPSDATFDSLMINHALVALVYWNNTNTTAYVIADERHGTVMSGETHNWLHNNIGATWKSGLTASGYTLNTKSDAALQFDVSDGEFHDEDIEFEIKDAANATGQYEQVLQSPAEIPVLYRDGDPGYWKEQAASSLPYINAGDNQNLAYNSVAGATWGQTPCGNTKFVVYTLVATDDWQYPIKMVQGNAQYDNKAAALEGAQTEITAWGTLPAKELTILYRLVMQTGVYSGVKNAQIIEVTDYRAARITGTSAVVQDHGTLDGLGDDDHAQYLLADGSRALAGAWNMGSQNLTNVNIDSGTMSSVTLDGAIAGGGQNITNLGDVTVANLITAGNVDGIDVSAHDIATTAIHGVGTGTISSVSTANKSIYVDKEATGAADGTSYTDAFTTIQDAVDSMEDLIIHAYTIYVRDGTKKTGTADENTLNHLVDDGNAQFVAGDVGKRVFNVTDGTWGVVGSYVDAGDVGIIDIAGAALDLFPDGNEAYVIEPTPYRESVQLNSSPATYPSHAILGSLTIRAEYYWGAVCDAQANAGEILDADVDFTGVEVGDRVWILDLNGANGRAQDCEIGTVDDVSQLASHIVRTTLTKTPTANWQYVIVKAEISGSDDGTDGGTARSNCLYAVSISNVYIYGFYWTFSDSWVITINNSRYIRLYYGIIENCDRGVTSAAYSDVYIWYYYYKAIDSHLNTLLSQSWLYIRYCAIDCAGALRYGIWLQESRARLLHSYIHQANIGVRLQRGSSCELYWTVISSNVTTGIHARENSTTVSTLTTNSATTPEDPVGTTEGAYIG